MRKGIFVLLGLVALAALVVLVMPGTPPPPPPPPPAVESGPPEADSQTEFVLLAIDDADSSTELPWAIRYVNHLSQLKKPLGHVKPPPPPPMDDLEAMRKWIAEAMRKVVPVSKQCWQKSLESHPEMQKARLSYALTLVAREGRKAALKDRDLQGDGSTDTVLRDCMLSALNRADFQLPASHPEMQVIYPLVFE